MNLVFVIPRAVAESTVAAPRRMDSATALCSAQNDEELQLAEVGRVRRLRQISMQILPNAWPLCR